MADKKPEQKAELGPPIDVIEVVLFGVARFRYWIVPFAIIGLAVGLGMALVKPNTYSSSAKLWIEWGKREKISTEQVLGFGGSRQAAPGTRGGFGLNEELTLIKTPEYFERIAREVGPEKLTEPIDPTRYDTDATPIYVRKQHELQDWWFNRGRKKDPEAPRGGLNLDSEGGLAAARTIIGSQLRLKPAGANVLMISYSARSPELAQDVVQAAVKVTMERHHEIFSERFKPEFVTAQLESARSAAELSSEEYHKHQKECGFVDIPTQKQQLLNKTLLLNNALEDLGFQLEDFAQDKKFYEAELETTPKRVTRFVEEQIGPNPIWGRLNDQIEAEQQRLAGLALEYVKDGPYYKSAAAAINERIEVLKQQLAETSPTTIVTEAHEREVENPDYQEIERELRRIENDKEKALAREVKLREEIERTEDELDALIACEPLHREMQAEISKAKATAGQFQRVIDERKALDALNQDEDLANIRVIVEPGYSPRKTGPQRSKDVLTGLVGGLVAGLVFGVLRQLLDSKLRYPGSVQKMLGVPVLGVIPEQRGWKRMGKKLRKAGA